MAQESGSRFDARAAEDEETEDEDKEKTYAEVVTEEAETDEGLFLVHRVDEKLLFEIPTGTRIQQFDPENERFLIVTQEKSDKISLRVVTNWGEGGGEEIGEIILEGSSDSTGNDVWIRQK